MPTRETGQRLYDDDQSGAVRVESLVRDDHSRLPEALLVTDRGSEVHDPHLAATGGSRRSAKAVAQRGRLAHSLGLDLGPLVRIVGEPLVPVRQLLPELVRLVKISRLVDHHLDAAAGSGGESSQPCVATLTRTEVLLPQATDL